MMSAKIGKKILKKAALDLDSDYYMFCWGLVTAYSIYNPLNKDERSKLLKILVNLEESS